MLIYPVLLDHEFSKTVFIMDIPVKPFDPAIERRHPQHTVVDFQRRRFASRYPGEMYKRPEEQSKG